MNKLYRVLILLVFFGLGIQCASAADTISFNPQTVEMDMDSSQNVQILIDEIPEGLSGFNITISIDPKIAEITAFSFPSWSTIPRNFTFPSSSVWVQCFDGNRKVDSGSNVLLGNITLTGKKAGTADLNISVDSYIDTDTKVKGKFNRIYPNAIPSKINILQSTPTITWSNPADITYGTALSDTQLNAVSSVPGDIVYTPAAGTVLGVGADQPLHSEFTPTDTANYTTASKDVTINVSKSTPTITWSNPADITYGTALSETQLNAVAKDPVTGNIIDGTYTYTPASGTVLGVGNGQNLRVDFTPTDTATYNGASANVQINVIPDTELPVINSVTLDSYTPNTGDSILVTVDTTDNKGVSEVKANGVSLVQSGNIWSGSIIAVEGTNPVNVFSADAAGNFVWKNDTTYTATTPDTESDVEQPVTDTDQPVIESVVLFPANTTAGSKIDISTNITDNIGVTGVTAGDVQLMNVDGNWQGKITAPLSPGKYSLSIKANDAAGNTVNTSVPYIVIRRQGSLNVAVLPTVSKIVGGKDNTLAIKVKNTQNIDDTFKVQINVNGLPAFYRAGTPWFDWTDKTLNLRAKQEVTIPIEVKVPTGTGTGFKAAGTATELKLFKVKVNSEKSSVSGSDTGYLVISHPRYIYVKKASV